MDSSNCHRRSVTQSTNLGWNNVSFWWRMIITALFSLVFIGLVQWLRPQTIPFDFWHFWYFRGTVLEVLTLSWPIFAWGIAANIIHAIRTHNDKKINRNAEWMLVSGGLVSLWAGIVEEIVFRWLVFYCQIAFYKFFNLLFFGWLGFGLLQWIFTYITGPIADLTTLHYLHPYLFGGFGWAVGAAILSSNGKFRKGHEYQGFWGSVNSWFLGMFFFYIMFTHGILAAMLVHFLYDMFIFVVHYIDAVIERKLGRA